MSSRVRKYIASSISDVEHPEVYELTRKLNRPFVESRQIEQFFPYVERHLDINFLFNLPNNDYVIKFENGKDSEMVLHAPMQQPKTFPRFFSLALPEIEAEEIKSVTTIIFDLGREHIFLLPEKAQLDDQDSPGLPERFNKKSIHLTVNKIEIWDSGAKTQDINIDFSYPETTELVSFLIPQIQKIDMLNSSELLSGSSTYISEFEIHFNILSIPNVSFLDNINLTVDPVLHSYSSMDLATPFLFSLKLNEIAENLVDKPDTKHIEINSGVISKILEPVYELSDELQKEILINLPSFQKAGAKFLYNSEFALLYDQFELNKELETVMALKMLLRTRAVKKVLILTSPEREYLINYYGKEILVGSWQSNLSLYLPDFAFNFYTSYNHFISEKHHQSIITGTTYDILERAFTGQELKTDYLTGFDLIILDDISKEILASKYLKSLHEHNNTNYLWFLTDYEDEDIFTTVNSFIADKELKILGRTKSVMQKSKRINYDYFLPLTALEKKGCEGNFTIGQEQLDDVIGLGNILRFRPNVFKIFQDEQKLLNFNDENLTSKKSDLLLYHLERIFARTKRVLLYTQYEDKGINQISNLLNESGIKVITFQLSDSNSQIKNKLETGLNYDGNLVYLTNLKANTIKYKFPGATHLINYDNWWNPITRWSIEDRLDISDSPKTVFNYYYDDTIESKVEFELVMRGLKEKSLIEFLPPEHIYSLFDDSDWCNVFEMQTPLFQKPEKYEPLIDNMKKLVENTRLIFTRFGFNDIETSANVRDYSFSVTACSKNGKVLAKCFYTEHLSSEFLNGIIKSVRKDDNFTHIFIVTNGTVSRTNLILPENISIIDGERFKRYLHVINTG